MNFPHHALDFIPGPPIHKQRELVFSGQHPHSLHVVGVPVGDKDTIEGCGIYPNVVETCGDLFCGEPCINQH
jgi:hypothetical protein